VDSENGAPVTSMVSTTSSLPPALTSTKDASAAEPAGTRPKSMRVGNASPSAMAACPRTSISDRLSAALVWIVTRPQW